MAVTNQTPRNSSTAAPGATVFPYDFKILDKSHLRVTVDGTARTVDTHFTVSGVGSDGGGNITFLSPLVGGEKIMRRRLMPFERLTDYQNLGDLRSPTLNNDQDSPVMMIQQLADTTLQLIEDPDYPGEFVWDAEGHRIINVGDALRDRDAVNLRMLYLTIEQVLTGGTISVNPKLWEITGNGEDTDFELPGADVSDPLFYDVVLAGLTKEPIDEYTIAPAADGSGVALRFETPPGDGVDGFVILRGYAKPYTGQPPVTSLRLNVVDVTAAAHDIVFADEFSFLRSTNDTAAAFTVKEIPIGGDPAMKMGDGSWLAIKQVGTAQVVLSPENANVSLSVPPGYLPRTRAVNSVIALTCEYGDGNQWTVSGDLAKAA